MTHAKLTHAMRARRQRGACARHGFTLIEILIVLAIIAILAALTYGALFQAQHTAREAKTKATIAKLHGLLMSRWESLHNRRLNLTYPTNATPAQIALLRLNAIRELQRLEMPDHYSDILVPPNTMVAPGLTSSLNRAYARKTPAMPDKQYEMAECLYLILTTSAGDESLTGQEFNNVDIGDTDGDGMKEFLDGWGNPICLVRWPVGFISDLQPRDPSGAYPIGDPVRHHDPFDVRNVHAQAWPRTGGMMPYPVQAFATFPLIYSMGPDGIADIVQDTSNMAFSNVTNNPYIPNYVVPTSGYNPTPMSTMQACIGQPFDFGTDGLNHFDNIHNHSLPVRQ